MLGVVADFMPSFWQQSTCNVSTNFNHTPSHHYWSQNSQETREEIHKCLFHTSLSLQTHPQPLPPTNPRPSSEFCWVMITRSVVYRVLKKKNVVDFTCSQELLPLLSNHPSATAAPPCTPRTNTNPRHPYAHPRERQQLTLKIC